MCCLGIPLLILGIFYIYKLSLLKADGFKLGMAPDALQAWSGKKRMQYMWGIAAIFGSTVISIVGFFVYSATVPACANSYYNPCRNQTGNSFIMLFGWILIPFVVLGVGMVLSWMASGEAKSIQMQAAPSGYAMPGGYPPPMPGAYPPAQGGWPQQPGAYPPAQGGWPQQPGAYPPPPVQPGAYPPAQGGWPQQPGAYPTPSDQPGAYPPPPPIDPQAPTGS